MAPIKQAVAFLHPMVAVQITSYLPEVLILKVVVVNTHHMAAARITRQQLEDQIMKVAVASIQHMDAARTIIPLQLDQISRAVHATHSSSVVAQMELELLLDLDIKDVAVKTPNLVAVRMGGLLLQILPRIVVVLLQNMVAVLMVLQKLRVKIMKDVKQNLFIKENTAHYQNNWANAETLPSNGTLTWNMEVALDFGMVVVVGMVIGSILQQNVKKHVLSLLEKISAICQRLKALARAITHVGTMTRKGKPALSLFTAVA